MSLNPWRMFSCYHFIKFLRDDKLNYLSNLVDIDLSKLVQLLSRSPAAFNLFWFFNTFRPLHLLLTIFRIGDRLFSILFSASFFTSFFSIMLVMFFLQVLMHICCNQIKQLFKALQHYYASTSALASFRTTSGASWRSSELAVGFASILMVSTSVFLILQHPLSCFQIIDHALLLCLFIKFFIRLINV